jgi:hypothetical protein
MRHARIVSLAVALTGLLLGWATPAEAVTSSPVHHVGVLVGTFQGHTSSFVPATADLTGRSTFAGRCTVPSNWVIGFTGTGTLKGFGDLTFTGTHCTQYDQNTGRGTFTDGRFTYVLASGDQFSGTHAGVFRIVDNVTHFTDAFVLTGGTGRFGGGKGGFLEAGTQDLATDLLQGDLVGALTPGQ